MNFKKLLPLLFVLIFNFWLIKIFQLNFLIGLLTLVSTISLYYKKFFPTLVLLTLLLIFQYKTSSINSLTFLNEQEKVEQIQKMHGYPPRFYRVSNWFEARPEALTFYKLAANLSEIIDPNLYFFANHPRERAGITEYEKFPYIFLPFFVYGVFSVKKEILKLLLLSLSPFVLLSIIGNSNPFGPFSLFPLLAANVSKGLIPVFENKKYFWIFIIVFCLIFIQTYTYATH